MKTLFRSFFAVSVGLVLGLFLCQMAGESPWHILKILAHSAFGSQYDFGMTLVYAVPLIFTGLSVSIAFQAGLFNIGSEGQLAMGAVAAAVAGVSFPGLAWPFAPILGVSVAMISGALWAWIPGALKAWRGSHEVINTIMLNFVAAGLTSWITLYFFRNPESQNPETASVGPAFVLSRLPGFDDAPVSSGLILALGCLVFYQWFLSRSKLGFEVRAVGENQNAASLGGISSKLIWIKSMLLAGAFSGLVGAVEVLGVSGRYKIGFSPGYGFIGIAVALLGRNRPLGILGAALLFGALQKGTSDLDLETENITRDLALILQALIILVVALDAALERRGFGSKSARGIK